MTSSDNDILALLRQPGPLTIDCASRLRLPAVWLAQAIVRADPVALTGASPELRWTLHLLGLAPRLGVEPNVALQPRSLPFQITLHADGGIQIQADRAIAGNKLLSETAAHSWVRPLELVSLSVDFAAVDMVNSVLVAWLLQLAQAARPAGVSVRNTRTAIATQFKQLRLDQMMTIA